MLCFWVISQGNDLSGSSALMPFLEPKGFPLPLMLITWEQLRRLLSLSHPSKTDFVFTLNLQIKSRAELMLIQSKITSSYALWQQTLFSKDNVALEFVYRLRDRVSLNPIMKKTKYARHPCIASLGIIWSSFSHFYISYSHFYIFMFLMFLFSFLFATFLKMWFFYYYYFLIRVLE